MAQTQWTSCLSELGMATVVKQDGGHPFSSPSETKKMARCKPYVNACQGLRINFTRI